MEPTKLRLMCSSGGHIIPRPHDKTLSYVGGDNRIISFHRHTTLLDLTHHLSNTLLRSPNSFTLKYQLPSQHLDSLISLTTDEDLQNMIHQYHTLNSTVSSSRIRLFVFQTNPDSVLSIGSFLDNPSKSEDWFLNALNGTLSGLSETSSVNCLLDLDDEISLLEKKDTNYKGTVGINVRGDTSGQDVHSILGSGQETTSCFGSGSSTPWRGDLTPIKVNMNDNQLMDLAVSSDTVTREQSDPFLLYNERLEQGLQTGYVKRKQQSTEFNLASSDSILSDLAITDQSSPVSQIQYSSSNNLADDPNDQHNRIQMLQQQQKVHNSAYIMSMPITQIDSPRHHQLHNQQPQFIPPPQYLHHHPSMAVPMTSYYQHHLPTDTQNLMYYIPTMQQPQQGYSFPLQQQQTTHADTQSAASTKTELPAGIYRTASAGASQLVRVPSGIHQPTQSIYYATLSSTAYYHKL